MALSVETNHRRNEHGTTIESKVKSEHGSVLMSLVVQRPSVASAGDLHQTLLRRLTYIIEETLEGH